MGNGTVARSWVAAGVALVVAGAGTLAFLVHRDDDRAGVPSVVAGVAPPLGEAPDGSRTGPQAVPGAGQVTASPGGTLAGGAVLVPRAADELTGESSDDLDEQVGDQPGGATGADVPSASPRRPGVTGGARDVTWDFGPQPASRTTHGAPPGESSGGVGAETVARGADGVVIAPPYRSSRTFFGTALSSSDGSIDEALSKNDALFGTLPIVRQFDPELPPDGAWGRRTSLHDRMVVFSFRKSPVEVIKGEHDAAITQFFREAPTRKPIFYSFWHEPEPDIKAGKFTPSEYRAAFRRVVRLVAATQKKNLYPTLILTGWTADPASGRNWRDYHPGDEYISVHAWDPYNGAHGNPARYKEPEEVFGHVVRVSKAAGKPWGIAETGTALVRGDTGQGRAVWLRRSGEYLEERGAAFVTYFQSVRDGDFKLEDQPSVRAWSKHVDRSKR